MKRKKKKKVVKQSKVITPAPCTHSEDNFLHFEMINANWDRSFPFFPYLELSETWTVKWCHPAGGVDGRLIIGHKLYKKLRCSVFLDTKGLYGNHQGEKIPYFEVYPVRRVDGKYYAERCFVHETKQLRNLINLSFRIQTDNFSRDNPLCKIEEPKDQLKSLSQDKGHGGLLF